MLIENIRENFVIESDSKTIKKQIKKLYRNHKKDPIEYLNNILFPEKTTPVKLPFKFYLPTATYQTSFKTFINTNSNGHAFFSYDFDNSGIPDFFSQFRLISGVMIIKSKTKGLITLAKNNNEDFSDINKIWGNRKLKLHKGARMIYTPHCLECFNFRYPSTKIKNPSIFLLEINAYEETQIEIEIVKNFEFIPKKTNYDIFTNSSSEDDSSDSEIEEPEKPTITNPPTVWDKPINLLPMIITTIYGYNLAVDVLKEYMPKYIPFITSPNTINELPIIDKPIPENINDKIITPLIEDKPDFETEPNLPYPPFAERIRWDNAINWDNWVIWARVNNNNNTQYYPINFINTQPSIFIENNYIHLPQLTPKYENLKSLYIENFKNKKPTIIQLTQKEIDDINNTMIIDIPELKPENQNKLDTKIPLIIPKEIVTNNPFNVYERFKDAKKTYGLAYAIAIAIAMSLSFSLPIPK